MKIDFEKIPEQMLPNFKGGDLQVGMRASDDGQKKIMQLRLEPGASIGMHAHTDNAEIIFPISGKGVALCDGVEEVVEPGCAHYCPRGSSHTLRNSGTEPLVMFAVVG